MEDAVQGLGFSETKLQRVETGLRDLRSQKGLRSLLERYGLKSNEDEISRLLSIQREAASQEWWTLQASSLNAGMPRFLGIEAAAEKIRAYHPSLILGLLQTEAYARTRHDQAKAIEETTTEFVEQSVRVRMMRKEALTRSEDPVHLWAVLYEPALRHVVGDTGIMREQYKEIDQLAGLPNVTIQVLPQTMRGYLCEHDFSILTLGGQLPTTVQVDTAFDTASVADKPREVGRFSRRFESLSRSALPPEDTPQFLHQLSRSIPE